MREAADFSVYLSGMREIDTSERVSLPGPRRDVERTQQCLTGEMRRLAGRGTGTEIDVRLAIIDRQQLRMTIGHVQQTDIAERRHIVEAAARLRECIAPTDRQPGRRSQRQNVQERAAVHEARCLMGEPKFEIADW